MRWAPESQWPFIVCGTLVVLSLMGFLVFKPGLGKTLSGVVMALALGAIVLVAVFFRDPERLIQVPEEMILSPADGRIMAVENVREDRHIQGQAQRVAIFMHVGNVHVQRMPTDGQLCWIQHFPGRYRPAMNPKAARDNEQQWYAFSGSGGKFTLVQIAGLLARRTKAWIEPGREYHRGDRVGMIVLGSEVDVYLPSSVQLQVQPGDIVRAGITVLGAW